MTTNHTNQSSTYPPIIMLQQMKQMYPKLFDFVAEIRNAEIAKTPGCCYCPSVVAYTYVITICYPRPTPRESIEAYINDNNILTQAHAEIAPVLAAWRMGLGIYRFDDTLAKALIETPSDSMPSSILYHIPEWCIYIETPWNEKSEGFFAMIDYDAEPILRLHFLRRDNPPASYPLPLAANTVGEAIKLRTESAQSTDKLNSLILVGKIGRDNGELLPHLPESLSLLLYLCSTEPDYKGSNRPSNPPVIKTKKGERIFPASSPRVWEIGYSIGEKLREAATMEGRRNIPEERNAPRPHLRRAHWHTYRVGKGKQGYRIRWVHPILVGFNNNEGEE